MVEPTHPKNISQNESKWESSTNRSENKKYLKPPPSKFLGDWERRVFYIILTQSHFLPFQSISFPRNFKTSPEHRPSPNEISSSNHWFSGAILVFSGWVRIISLSRLLGVFCWLLMFPPNRSKNLLKKICLPKRSFKKCCRGCFARKSSKNCRYISVSNLREIAGRLYQGTESTNQEPLTIKK